MPIDYTLAAFGLAGFISIASSVFVYITKGKVENQTNALKEQSDNLKQIEAMAESLETEMTRSKIKLTNIVRKVSQLTSKRCCNRSNSQASAE